MSRFYSRYLMLFFTLFVFLFSSAMNIGDFFCGREGMYSGHIELRLKNLIMSGTDDDGRQIFTAGNIVKLSNALDRGIVSYISEQNVRIERGNLQLPVKAIKTDCNYTSFAKMDLMAGSFPGRNVCENGDNIAVISEDLALTLFSSREVIGEKITLYDMNYTVTGIYKKDMSLTAILGSDGLEKVFIPAFSLDYPERQEIDTVFIKDEGLELESFREQKVEVLLSSVLKIDAGLYKIIDCYNAPEVFQQFRLYILFFIGAWVIVILILWLARYIRQGLMEFRSFLNDLYFIEALKSNKKWILKISLTAMAATVCIIGIFTGITGKLYIPYQYVPPENIFDMGFYAGKLKTTVYQTNTSYGYIPAQFEIDFKNTLRLYVILLILSVTALLIAVLFVKLHKLVGDDLWLVLRTALYSLSAGLTLSFVLSLVCRFGFVFPTIGLAMGTALILLNSSRLWYINNGYRKQTDNRLRDD